MNTEIDWRALSEVFDYYASGDHGVLLDGFYFWLVDQLDEQDVEPERVLEVGCGTGLFVERMLEWFPEAQFELVDKFAPMLNRARERFPDDENVLIHETDGEAWLEECAAESFDLVVFCRSFYTLADPARAAANVMKVLAPGGLAAIYDFTGTVDLAPLEERNAADDPKRWPVCRAAIEEFNQGVESGVYHVFDEDDFAKLWQDAGAEVVGYESHEPDSPNHRICVQKPR